MSYQFKEVIFVLCFLLFFVSSIVLSFVAIASHLVIIIWCPCCLWFLFSYCHLFSVQHAVQMQCMAQCLENCKHLNWPKPNTWYKVLKDYNTIDFETIIEKSTWELLLFCGCVLFHPIIQSCATVQNVVVSSPNCFHQDERANLDGLLKERNLFICCWWCN